VHGLRFGEIRPANTLLPVAALVGTAARVEIELEAVVRAPSSAAAAFGRGYFVVAK
jgi:hypothetical protein